MLARMTPWRRCAQTVCNAGPRHLRASPADLGYGLLLTPCQGRLARRTSRPLPRRSRTPSLRWRRCSGSFRLMVGIGVVLLGLFCRRLPATVPGQAGAIPVCSGRCSGLSRCPGIAIEVGWFVAEFGRQPGPSATCCRSPASVSLLQPGQLWFSLISISSLSTARCWWWSCSCCVT